MARKGPVGGPNRRPSSGFDFVMQIISRQEQHSAGVFGTGSWISSAWRSVRIFAYGAAGAVAARGPCCLCRYGPSEDRRPLNGSRARFIRAEDARTITVLISDLLNILKLEEIRGLYAAQGLSIEVAPDVDLAQPVRSLRRRLAEIKPRRTYMLLHQLDSVSVAAVQPDLVGGLIFPQLRITAGAWHSHPARPARRFQRQELLQLPGKERVENNVVWPLVAEDLGHRVDRPFFARGHLTTCSSGGFRSSV